MTRTIVQDEATYAESYAWIAASDLRVVDTETTGLTFHADYIVGVGVLAREESFYFPFRHFEGVNLPEHLCPKLGAMLHASFTSTGKRASVMGYNYQYDAKMWLPPPPPPPPTLPLALPPAPHCRRRRTT